MDKKPTKRADLTVANLLALALAVLLGYASLWVQVRLIMWGSGPGVVA